MKPKAIAGLLFLAALTAASSGVEGQDSKALLGAWKGTSLCVNREATPACKDEEVVYEFREASPRAAGKLTMSADKIVNGDRQPMGDLDFAWDAKAGAWVCELQMRFHGLWSFLPPKGDELAGTLVLLPDRTVVRNVAVRRVKASK
jgi:hypothetical protein